MDLWTRSADCWHVAAGVRPRETLLLSPKTLQAVIDLTAQGQHPAELPRLLLPLFADALHPDIAAYYTRTGSNDYELAFGLPAQFWSSDVSRPFRTRPGATGALGQSVRTRAPVLTTDPSGATAAGRYVPFADDISSEIVVPIVAREGFLSRPNVPGVLAFSRRSLPNYSEDDVAAAQLLARLASNIYDQSPSATTRNVRATFLRQLLAAASDDPLFIPQAIVRATYDALRLDFVSLWTFNALDNSLVLSACWPHELAGRPVDFDSFDTRVLASATTLSGQVLRASPPRAVAYPNPLALPDFANPAFARLHSLRWMISVPILDDSTSQPLAVVNLWPADPPQDYAEETLGTLAQSLASIAVPLRLGQAHRQASLLAAYDAILQILLAFEDDPRSWDTLASLIRDQLQCEACSVFLADAQGLVLRGTTGIEGDPPYRSVRYGLGEGLTGHVLESRRPFIYYADHPTQLPTAHKSKFREALRTSAASRSILFVPIRTASEQAIGVIRCNNKFLGDAYSGGRFTSGDLSHLQAIATAVAGVLRKARELRALEAERLFSLACLHHELLAPVDAMNAHTEWLDQVLLPRLPKELEREVDLTRVKFSDMRQNAKLLEVLVATLAAPEDLAIVRQPCSLAPLLEACRTFLSHEARALDVRVTIDYLGLPQVPADPLHLMRVFHNILRNAIRYRDQQEPQRHVRVSATETATDICLSFEDNGIGVARHEVEAIFRRLHRAENARRLYPQGSGLGLAYCRDILRLHGGAIWVDEGSGSKPTVFMVRLPKREA